MDQTVGPPLVLVPDCADALIVLPSSGAKPAAGVCCHLVSDRHHMPHAYHDLLLPRWLRKMESADDSSTQRSTTKPKGSRRGDLSEPLAKRRYNSLPKEFRTVPDGRGLPA